MTFLPEAETLLKDLEGKRLESYQDQGGIWTVGYGHTGPDIGPGLTITDEQAEAWLRSDIDSFCNRVTLRLRTPLNDYQFSAAVICAFNLKNWYATPLFALLSAGKCEEAKAHWLLYDKITMRDGSKVQSDGLLNRRKRELELFCKAP